MLGYYDNTQTNRTKGAMVQLIYWVHQKRRLIKILCTFDAPVPQGCCWSLAFSNVTVNLNLKIFSFFIHPLECRSFLRCGASSRSRHFKNGPEEIHFSRNRSMSVSAMGLSYSIRSKPSAHFAWSFRFATVRKSRPTMGFLTVDFSGPYLWIPVLHDDI